MNNIATVEVFEEDYRLRNGAYQPGVFNGTPDANLLSLGWRPQENDGTVYTIVLVGGSYTVTAVGSVRARRFAASFPRRSPVLSSGFKRFGERVILRARAGIAQLVEQLIRNQ